MKSLLKASMTFTTIFLLSSFTTAHARISLSDLQAAIDELAAKVEMLQTENQAQQAEIDLLLSRPTLVEQSCPGELGVIGIDSDGGLICAAPWEIPTDGEPPDLQFTCVQNYNVSFEQAAALAFLENDLRNQLLSTLLPPVNDTATVLEIFTVDYSLTFDPLNIGDFTYSAELVELTGSEPCADALGITIEQTAIVVEGQWHADSDDLSLSSNGTFRVIVTGVDLQLLAHLSDPIFVGPSLSSDREIESVSLIQFTALSDIQIELPDSLFVLEETLTQFLRQRQNLLSNQLAGVIVEAIESYLLSSVSAPVTVEWQ